MLQEARHSRRWSGLQPSKHARAAAAGGLLSHQPTAGGRAWAETHRELLERAITRSLLLPTTQFILFYLLWTWLKRHTLSKRPSPPSRPASIATLSKAQLTLRLVRLESFWTLRMRKRHVLFILPFLYAACVTNGTRASYSLSA